MLVKPITYTNFDGETVTEEFAFHLSRAELIEMEMSKEGGFAAYLQKIVDAQDGQKLVETFKDLVLKSYGKKSEDGRRFIKNEELSREFQETEAYSELFMQLATNTDAAIEFVNGIMPRNLSEEVSRIPGSPQQTLPKSEPEEKVMTKVRAASMDPDELKERLLDGWTISD